MLALAGTRPKNPAELKALAAGQRQYEKGERDSRPRQLLRGRARPASTLLRFVADHRGHRRAPDGLRWGVVDLRTQLTELGAVAPSFYDPHRRAQPPRGCCWRAQGT